jgi:hypothetical protein
MNHLAIYALYPQVVMVDEGTGAFDAQGNQVEIDLALVNAWQDPDAYKYARAREYPDFKEYLDGIVKGDKAQIADYIAKCQAVKNKYPKEQA